MGRSLVPRHTHPIQVQMLSKAMRLALIELHTVDIVILVVALDPVSARSTQKS